MCNETSNNIILAATTISIWIFNSLSSDTVNYLANLLQMIGQNLSSMLSVDTCTENSGSNNIDTSSNE